MGTGVKYRFAGLELDVGRRLLLRDGNPVRLQKKPLELLLLLLQHRDRAVGKEEILGALWPGEFVSEASLAACVAKLRRAVGEDRSAPRVVATLHGFGYRFVAGLAGESDGFPAGAARQETAASCVVGRDAELARLAHAWNAARAGERRLVLLAGEGGVGKTALVEAFLGRIEAGRDTPIVLRGDCLDLHGGEEPLLPLLDAWSGVCRGPAGSSAVDILRRTAPGWLLQVQGLVGVDERVRLQQASRGMTPELSLRTLCNALRELSTLGPVVLVVEDLHWADPATLDALGRIVRDRARAPLLVLVTSRPEFSVPGQRQLLEFVSLLERLDGCEEIGLGRLAADATAAVVRDTATTIEPTEALCAALHARTGGHPLFLRAAVRHLERGGHLDEVPDDLRRTIAAAIDDLPEAARRLAEAASVVGAEFAAAAVGAAVEAPLEDVEEALLEVARSSRILAPGDLAVWPDGTESRRFRFCHPYYAEIAAQRASRARQQTWHRRIAERLRAGHAGSLSGAVALRIARHFESAGNARETLAAFDAAIAAAQQEYSAVRVAAAATAALALLEQIADDAERDRRELGLRMALGPALLAQHGYVAAPVRANYERLLDLARRGDAVGARFLALLTLSAIHQTHGDGPATRACADEVVALAEATMPEDLQVLARARLGQVLAASGELATARRYIEAAREVAADPGLDGLIGAGMWIDPVAAIDAYLGLVRLLQGEVGPARQAIAAAVDRTRQAGRPFSLAMAHLLAAGFHVLARDTDQARASSEAFVDLALREGIMGVVDQGLMYWFARLVGAPDRETVDGFAAALADHERRGIGHMSPLLLCCLAEACGRLGRHAQGLAAVDAAQARIAGGGEAFVLAEVHRLRAELLLARAARPRAATERQAEAEFRAAITVARAQGARLLELRATVAWARLVAARGRDAEAREMLARLHDTFAGEADAPDLDDARRLLAGS